MDDPRLDIGTPGETDLADDRLGRLTPEMELELMDEKVKLAADDERKTMFDPNTAPKPPHAKEEGVTDLLGEANVDIQRDTALVDELAKFDLDAQDLSEIEAPGL